MKKRFLFHTIHRYLKHKNALVITGMRQTGKTTLLRQIFDITGGHKLWFDFDNPLDMLYFEDIDYHNIYKNLVKSAGGNKGRMYVFIDEIQNMPDITKIMKFHIDHYRVKYIVTGSSNFYLRNLFPESLSGRKFLFVLPVMSFKEYLYFHERVGPEVIEEEEKRKFPEGKTLIEYKKWESEYNTYLEFGGFPEVVLTGDAETKKLVLKNIFASFFEKDIRIFADIKDIRELRDLILLLVPRTGNILDITRLSSELGINRVKMYNYLEFLQGVFLIKLIPKYSHSIDRSVAGGRKVYFTDSGLLNIIGKVNEGQLFENTVANQLSHYGGLTYYNKRNTAEIDFIIDKELAFEVKLNATKKDLEKLCRYWLVTKKYSELDKTLFPMFL